MPVVNRHFSFSVEIDKPKVGRIRTVMPDGPSATYGPTSILCQVKPITSPLTMATTKKIATMSNVWADSLERV